MYSACCAPPAGSASRSAHAGRGRRRRGFQRSPAHAPRVLANRVHDQLPHLPEPRACGAHFCKRQAGIEGFAGAALVSSRMGPPDAVGPLVAQSVCPIGSCGEAGEAVQVALTEDPSVSSSVTVTGAAPISPPVPTVPSRSRTSTAPRRDWISGRLTASGVKLRRFTRPSARLASTAYGPLNRAWSGVRGYGWISGRVPPGGKAGALRNGAPFRGGSCRQRCGAFSASLAAC